MTARRSRGARVLAVTVLLAAAGVLLAPLFRPPATAVTQPADGAVLGTAPGLVRIDLPASADPTGVHVTVTGADSRPVGSGPAAAEGTVVRQPLRPLPPGEYRIVHHVELIGGGAVAGTARFTVGPAPAAGGAAESPAGGHAHGHPIDPVTGVVLAANVATLLVIAVREARRRWRPGAAG